MGILLDICSLEIFDPVEFDKWVGKTNAPAIESSLKLYGEVLELGFKVFLLTGRSEKHRSITVDNLNNSGFQNWDKLIESSLKLYGEVLGLGFKVFLLTGPSEKHRSITVDNLNNSGLQNWDKLILRNAFDVELLPENGGEVSRNEGRITDSSCYPLVLWEARKALAFGIS
ncbi:hypothetical protein Ddye_024006 [Dipteronia dyeriana]|uniref:Uncharacterized protein n=1 Tax=Dipteronia dyeriana TaxID=168575 RepID=A0AAD9WTS7_9ROSI|nr:hypothetical protein Ddye_024006 [Dipteronia dyeriana]